MARKRIEGTTLESWGDVDQGLARIGEIDRDLALIEVEGNQRIDEIKAAIKCASATLLDKKAALELAIKEYCETNRAEFAKVKSKDLTFGSVGFRLSTKIMIKRVAETLQAMKDLALTHCIRTREEPDKEAMKSLTDETLAAIGAARKTENVFGYEIKQEQIKEAA